MESDLRFACSVSVTKLTSLFFILFVSMYGYSQDLKQSKSGLNYLVHNPKIKTANNPLIVLLHGFGSNEEDLFSFADQLPGKFLVVSARAPISLGEHSYAWYNIDFSTAKPAYQFQEEEKSRNQIIQFIQEIKLQYKLEGHPVYLCGFSQGAIMSYSVGLTRPDLVNGIAIMSGRLLDEIKTKIAPVEKLKQVRYFISHGTQDPVLEIQNARNAVQYLKSIGINPLYKEYHEGHGINGEMFRDLVWWLEK